MLIRGGDSRRLFVACCAAGMIACLAIFAWISDLHGVIPSVHRPGKESLDENLKPLKDIDLSDGFDYSDSSTFPQNDEDLEPEGDLSRLLDTHERVPATFVSLVRNGELDDLVHSVLQIEAAFNYKFGYPWTFFNDEPFTDEFKEKVQRAVGDNNCTFVQLSREEWEEPMWINRTEATIRQKKLKEDDDVQYADMPSYHRMCRWYSGPFFMHPALDEYKYYWRVEPKTDFYCDIDYDLFAYMEKNEKVYGFVISLYDSAESVRTLWPHSQDFFIENPDFISDHPASQWLVNEDRTDHNEVANGYSTCHFWSNFEIGALDFFRSLEYQAYFNHLDSTTGFFYERWGDAPVHSIALAMMADKARIHYFKDIGYRHSPYMNCPATLKCQNSCEAGKFTDSDILQAENCIHQWFKVAGTG